MVARSQRRGIGRRLTLTAAERLAQIGVHSMLVWVLAANAARAFHEALGGKLLREKEIVIGEAALVEVAYGWEDVRTFIGS